MTAPTTPPETKVMFRWWKGEIISLFPFEVTSESPHLCSSYMRVGQHGAADPWRIIRESRPATPAELTPLQTELERIGYVLKIVKNQRGAYNARRELIARLDAELIDEPA